MVSLKIKVIFDEEVLGTAPGNPKVYDTYIGQNAPDKNKAKEESEAVENAEMLPEKIMTVFPRDEQGNPIIWDYQWKGFFKDAFGSLKKLPKSECGKVKAYKKEIDGLIFVEPRKIPVEMNGEIGECQRPLRAQTPQGERITLAASETVPVGSSIIFTIKMLLDSHEKAVIEALDYGALRGFGQWRNSGKGRFHYEILDRTEK